MLPTHLLVFQTDCAPGTDDEFNRWYNEVHIPELLRIPGFKAATRYRVADAQMGRRSPDHRYLALYEIEADTAQEALDALNAKTAELAMSDTLLTGPGQLSASVWTSLNK
jgi:hypothetical protein